MENLVAYTDGIISFDDCLMIGVLKEMSETESDKVTDD